MSDVSQCWQAETGLAVFGAASDGRELVYIMCRTIFLGVLAGAGKRTEAGSSSEIERNTSVLFHRMFYIW